MICEIYITMTLIGCKNPNWIEIRKWQVPDAGILHEYYETFPSKDLVRMLKSEGLCIKGVVIKRDSDTIEECKIK